MTDAPPDMWPYWKEQYGPIDALESQYRDLLRTNVDLQMALAQMRNSERAVDSIMLGIAGDGR